MLYQLLVLQLRRLALPLLSKRATRRAHADVEYSTTPIPKNGKGDAYKHIPRNLPIALFLTRGSSLRDFELPKNKALDKRLICKMPSTPLTLALKLSTSEVKTGAKIRNNFETKKKKSGKVC